MKAPTVTELDALIDRISERVGRYLERTGLLVRDMDNSSGHACLVRSVCVSHGSRLKPVWYQNSAEEKDQIISRLRRSWRFGQRRLREYFGTASRYKWPRCIRRLFSFCVGLSIEFRYSTGTTVDRKVPIGRLSVTAVLMMYIGAGWPAAAEELSAVEWLSNEDSRASGEAADDGVYYFKIQYAQASETDFSNTLYFDYEQSPDSGPVTALSVGKKLSDSLFGLPLDVAGYFSVQRFDENGFQPDAYGVSGYVKVFYDFHLPKEVLKLRVGLGEGLSYVSRIPMAEKRDFASKDAESQNLLIYLEYSLDVPLSQFSGRKFGNTIDEVYIGYTVLHRSSVFGFLGETGGGVNYQGMVVEFVF